MNEERIEAIEVTEMPASEDGKETSFGVKDCGVVVGIAVAGIAAYELGKRGVKWVGNTAIPAIKKKVKGNKTETSEEAPAQEPVETKKEKKKAKVKDSEVAKTEEK